MRAELRTVENHPQALQLHQATPYTYLHRSQNFYGNFFVPSISPFLNSFNHKWVLNFVKDFFCICWDDHMVLSFKLLIWYITLIDLCILKNPCISGINATLSWCMSFLMCCWILFDKIFLRILHLCSSVILAYSFLFCVLSLSGFGIKVMMAS